MRNQLLDEPCTECESLRHQLADEKLCHEETRERVAELENNVEKALHWNALKDEQLAASQKHIVYSTQEWNDLKDELASALDDLDREVRVGNDYLQRIAELEAVIKSQSTKETLLDAHASMVEREDVPCNPHPDAPHGFDRNASHSAGYYICECHGWEPK